MFEIQEHLIHNCSIVKRWEKTFNDYWNPLYSSTVIYENCFLQNTKKGELINGTKITYDGLLILDNSSKVKKGDEINSICFWNGGAMELNYKVEKVNIFPDENGIHHLEAELQFVC